jgi:putative ABC transport system permease protein
VLNILGLAVAFAVFYPIAVQVYYDFSFDKNFEKANNIYLVTTYNAANKDDCAAATFPRRINSIGERFPEIQNFCYIRSSDEETFYETFDIKDSDDNVHMFRERITYASTGFVDMFTPEILAGDARQALMENDKVMLTESTAKKFFGNEDPLGKIISFHDQTTARLIDSPILTVAAVCKDFPDNCSLSNGIYVTLDHDDNRDWCLGYIEISSDNVNKIVTALNKDDITLKRADGAKWLYEFIALPDVHLTFPAVGKGNLVADISLLAVGILLIIIAYINFVNFSVAMAPVRLKGFNIRRIMGESAFFLKFSIIMEAALFSFISFLISIFFVIYLNTSIISEFFTADLALSKNYELLTFLGIISLATGFMVGIYPAFYSIHFTPAIAISGSFYVSSGSKILKNILIVFQFAVAIFFVVVTLHIKMQNDHIQNKSWGITMDNILYINTVNKNFWHFDTFEKELQENPAILDITHVGSLPGSKWVEGEHKIDNQKVDYSTWIVGHNFFRFFGVDIINGRDFREEDDKKVIINKMSLERNDIEFKEGMIMENPLRRTPEIIGVSEDFNFLSLHEPLGPMAFWLGKKEPVGYILIKTTGLNLSGTIDYINETWNKFSNVPAEVCFLDIWLDDLYKEENNLTKLTSMSSLITIIITIMGVYGLILFNVKSKRKTIALHKINGASVKDVILMLNRSFIVQFVIAYLVAVPIAYIVVNRWLENFAYKTPIHWWVFIAGGLLVFIITALTVSYQSYKAATANPIDGIKTE